jgi:hypothetical protein
VLHYYVGLGIFPWAYIKRRIQYGPWENEIKLCSSSRLSCASSRQAYQEDHMFEACRPFGDNGLVKMSVDEAIPQ